MTIEEYLDRVSAALRVPAAQAGVDDLRSQLLERADVVGEAAACDELGPPERYASALDEAFTDQAPDDFDPPAAEKLWGVPYSFRVDGSWWRRLFNPSDPRILVPHVLGWGYSVNVGAVAVRLGLLRPDDLDTDTLAELRAGDATAGLVVLSAAGLGNLARAARSPQSPSDRRDAVLGALVVAAAVSPSLTGGGVIQRLAAQSFGLLVTGAVLAKAVDRRRPRWGALAVAAGCGAAVANLVVPVRAAVRRSAEHQLGRPED